MKPSALPLDGNSQTTCIMQKQCSQLSNPPYLNGFSVPRLTGTKFVLKCFISPMTLGKSKECSDGHNDSVICYELESAVREGRVGSTTQAELRLLKERQPYLIMVFLPVSHFLIFIGILGQVFALSQALCGESLLCRTYP